VSGQVLFLGGNGHCAARLAPARAALAVPPAEAFELVEIAYPGFEGRPRAASLEAFLDGLAAQVEPRVNVKGWQGFLYGTGIGGLLALCLRARDAAPHVPLLLQAPVLWGLERRMMPRLMRSGPLRWLLGRTFARPAFQSWFVRRYFERPPAPGLRAAFFAGYADGGAAADLFAWLAPALLRRLEEQFRGRPERLQNITIWWGARDRVVTLRELAVTEAALGVAWPVRVFRRWGHYPMIDDPDGWVRALAHELATAASVPGPVGPQAR
jgi:hypothetical protein